MSVSKLWHTLCIHLKQKAMFGILEKLHRIYEVVVRTEQTQHLINLKLTKNGK